MKGEQTVLRGSLLLIASAAAAKILGAVFRIPLTAMLGGTGMGYFSCAYGMFLPVFALSVTGINTAVSAVTAQALAHGETAQAGRIRRQALRMFGFGGFGCSLLLWFASDPICTYLLRNPQAALAVKCFSPAVWFCCMNAVLRGMQEGSRRMTPTAVSQTAEGIGRVLCGLFLCRWAMTHADRLLPVFWAGQTREGLGAAAAILGVTLSTAIGFLTLCGYARWETADDTAPKATEDRAVRRQLWQILLPVAAASLVTNLTTLIDLAAGLRLLLRTAVTAPARLHLPETVLREGAAAAANFAYGAFTGLAMTVFNLVPSITNMLGKGVFPTFAQNWEMHNFTEAKANAETVFHRTAFLAIPAGLGITALSYPILHALFPSRPTETAAAAAPLMILGIAVIFAAMSYPLFSMMQASGFAGETVTVMLWGAAVKLLANLLLIPLWGLCGAAASTALCYLVILLLALYQFRRKTGIRLTLGGQMAGILVSGLICAAAARAVNQYMHGASEIVLICAVCAGGAAYGLMQLLLYFYRSRKKRFDPTF